MLTRRSFMVGAVVASAVSLPAAAQAAPFNQYAADLARRGWSHRIVPAGARWNTLFPAAQVTLAQYLNRQNVQLDAGQVVLTPERGVTMTALSPLPPTMGRHGYYVLVDLNQCAWALYDDGQQVRWGPAIGGSSWCADVGRPCRTPAGTFQVTEVAGPDRRSRSYPIDAAAEGRGAPMPYFMRLTPRGVGLHARYVHGSHVSHGCIGMFYDDAQWLNTTIARRYPLTVTVQPYT